MYVVVVGGGKVGYYLVKTLVERGNQVALVEKDPLRCRRLAEEFESILTICGDGTVTGTLADAGADHADVLAAVTGKDEENLVICQLAKRKFAVARAVVRASNPKNVQVMRQLGVDLVVSSTSIIADLIQRELAQESIRTLLTFHHGDMALVEVDLREESYASGRTVQELAKRIPTDSVLVSVLRGDQVIFPRGDTVLASGDTLMALSLSAHADDLRQAVQDHPVQSKPLMGRTKK